MKEFIQKGQRKFKSTKWSASSVILLISLIASLATLIALTAAYCAFGWKLFFTEKITQNSQVFGTLYNSSNKAILYMSLALVGLIVFTSILSIISGIKDGSKTLNIFFGSGGGGIITPGAKMATKTLGGIVVLLLLPVPIALLCILPAFLAQQGNIGAIKCVQVFSMIGLITAPIIFVTMVLPLLAVAMCVLFCANGAKKAMKNDERNNAEEPQAREQAPMSHFPNSGNEGQNTGFFGGTSDMTNVDGLQPANPGREEAPPSYASAMRPQHTMGGYRPSEANSDGSTKQRS